MKNKFSKSIVALLALSMMSGCNGSGKNPELIIDTSCPTTVECGKEVQLLAKMENTKEKGIVWSVDDDLIATVTKDGKLSALRKGHVLAKATSVYDPDIHKEIDIEVKKNTLIAVEITNKVSSMKVGETKKFSASINGDNTNSGIGWQVNNEALATIDQEGNLTVRQIGIEKKVIVTAFSKINPDAFAECEVTLSPKDNGDKSEGNIEEINGYKLIFEDNFSSERLNKNNWDVMIGDGAAYGVGNGWGNEEKQYYAEDNLKVVDGNLIITAKDETHRKEVLRNMEYTSGRIRSRAKVAYTYGRIEARISCPYGSGIWPAFWMLPETTDSDYGGWPNSGEIDIMEVKGRQKRQMFGTLHFAKEDGTHTYENVTKFFETGEGDIKDFHDYAVEWDENEIRFYADGKIYGTINSSQWSMKKEPGKNRPSSAPFDKKFHILINMAVGGNFDGYRLPDLEDLPARMQIDYVKWYQK